MADIGKVMFLDLRKAQIEETARKYDIEAEAELLEASEEYKRDKGVEA